MARFLRSIAQPNVDLVASVDITPFDLPVNPLSFLLLRFQITNVAPAAVATYSAIDDVIDQITAIRILHKGEQIMSGSLRDLMVLNMAIMGAMPGWGFLNNDDNALRSVVFPLCLGRRMYDPMSCFPATTRGNLRFEMTAGADGAGYDDINFSVEAVELIDAQPTEHLKATTISDTSVAGQFDVRLPIGHPLLGVLLFDTGLAGATDESLSWGALRLLKDNVEQYYSTVDYEVLAGEMNSRLKQVLGWPGHRHQVFDTAGVTTLDQEEAQVLVSQGVNGYALLDFDPLRDGSYQLETEGAADLRIRATGDEATAVRALPVERIMIR